MNQQFRNRSLPAGNPLANVLVVIAGIVVISLSLALGFVVFIGIACFMLIAAAVVTVRIWWLKKRMGFKPGAQTTAGAEQPSSKSSASIRVIEGEFQEVKPEEKDFPRH